MYEQRCTFLFLLMAQTIIAVGTTSTATSTTTKVTPSPTTSQTQTADDHKINYSCSENHSISIHLDVKNSYSLFAVGAYTIKSGQVVFGKTNDTSCKSTLSNVTEPVIELQGCTDNPVYVYFMKDSHSDIFGGRDFHEYRLNCTLPEEGLKGSATYTAKPTNTADQVIKQNEHFKYVTLVMELSETTVKIADMLTVTIKKNASSAVPGFVLPTQCVASNGKTDDDYKQLDLLKEGVTADEDALTNFTINADKTATANLYAFRFVNSDTVVLTCDVTVCYTKWCNNQLNGIYGKNPAASRRRRRSPDNDDYSQEFQVSATMKIKDQWAEIETSGQRCVHFNQMTIVPVILAIVYTKLRLW